MSVETIVLKNVKEVKGHSQLVNEVKEWAVKKGIVKQNDPLRQVCEILSESKKLETALSYQHIGHSVYIDERNKTIEVDNQIKKQLGEIYITLLTSSILQKVDLLDCLEIAMAKKK